MATPLSNLAVGTQVRDLDTKYCGIPIVWRIAGKSHLSHPSGSITLESEKILTIKCFDAMEPSNSDINVKGYGNNIYSTSNIEAWLNSDAQEGAWYAARHAADAPPIFENLYNNYNSYSMEAGFLNGFSDKMKNAIMTTTVKVARNLVTGGGGYANLTRKVFIASTTEVGLPDEGEIAEGYKLAIYDDDNSRIAGTTACAADRSEYKSDDMTQRWSWYLRTPVATNATSVRYVDANGRLDSCSAFDGTIGVRPLLCVPAETFVADYPDADGIFKFLWNEPAAEAVQTTLGGKSIGDIVSIKVDGKVRYFIVAHKGKPSEMYDDSFNGGVWLVMKDVYETRYFHRSSVPDYINSDICAYLNNELLNLIDENIRNKIVQVKIPYAYKDGTSAVIMSGADGFESKVFLLSIREVGATESGFSTPPVKDGASLNYFFEGSFPAASLRRVGYLNGTATA